MNSASFSDRLAPGTLASIYGDQLATSIETAASVPLATQLNGVTVRIGGLAAPLLYVSPSQVNFLIPFEAAALKFNQQISMPLIVDTPSGSSAAFPITLSRSAPALFTFNGAGSGNAIAFDASLGALKGFDGNPIILYATGMGPTDPPASSANGGASSEPLNRDLDFIAVIVGDQPANVLFEGLAPGLPGVYQLNVVPKAPISNRVYLLGIDGVPSNIATLAVPAGINVTNLSGSIDGLYPASGAAPVTFSALLIASIFKISFDINPDAKPFQVIARNAAASDVIDIDPARGTWQATIRVPTAAERVYDFSANPIGVIDFTTGMFFPGNFIPLSRTDPIARSAMNALPVPNQISNGLATTVVSGTLPSNRHFVIDANTLDQVSRFGEFIRISQNSGTTQLQLFADGLLVASKEIPYLVN